VSALGLKARRQRPVNSPPVSGFMPAEPGAPRVQARSDAAARSASKTNWHSYLLDGRELISILSKQTGTLMFLILKEIVLKILKRFIRCEQYLVLSRQLSAKTKTNWHAYPSEIGQFNGFSGKQTGTHNRLNQQDLILKILKRFIRCEQQSAF
jgi:hypothetical protein